MSRLQKSCQAPSCCFKPVAAIDEMNHLSVNELARPSRSQCLNSGFSSKQALMMCQLRIFKQIGTSDPQPEVAICQPGSVTIPRDRASEFTFNLGVSAAICSMYYFWLNKMDKLQALPGVWQASATDQGLNTCLPLRERLRQTLQLSCYHVLCSDTPKMSGSDCSVE